MPDSPRNMSRGPMVRAARFSSLIPCTISVHSNSRYSGCKESPRSVSNAWRASCNLPWWTRYLGDSGTKRSPAARKNGTMNKDPRGIWYDPLSSRCLVAFVTAAPMMLPAPPSTCQLLSPHAVGTPTYRC